VEPIAKKRLLKQFERGQRVGRLRRVRRVYRPKAGFKALNGGIYLQAIGYYPAFGVDVGV
jgi:hypothetical protein